jgi:hypothetical protein
MSRIWKTPQQVDVNQDPGLIPPVTPKESLGVGFTNTVNTETTSSQTTGNIVNNIYITRNGPGGRSGELQFNEGGAYTGDSGLFYDPNTDTLTTGTININQLNANNANLGSVNNLTILGGNNNDVLKTNGSGVITWASAFPPDGSNSGKFLMTNGISQVWSNVSYANLVDIPANIATTDYVGNAIANLVDSSPAAMNTLNELATALGNNANYATDITNILANKANITYVDNVTANITWANLSGKPTIPAAQINSDWTEINSLSKAFIQNKPTLGNISSINISGSSTQVLYGNGVFGYLPAGTGNGIVLTDISVGTPNSASGSGGLSYANSTGVFTYTPPVIPTSFSNLVNGSHILSLGSTGKLTLPTAGIVRNGTDTTQVGSTTTIATDSNSGTGNQTPGVVDVPFSAPIISTYPPGSTITFQNGDIRTITGIVQQSGGGGYLDINYSGAPTTSNPEFPIILKTSNYAAATTAPEWTFSASGNLTLPTNSSRINYANGTSILSGITGGGIALTDISVGAPNSASGGGGLSYANTTGVFTYTPPVIPAAQIQSDWNQTDNTLKDFIKNKPTLVTNLDSLSDVTITSASSGQVLKYNGTAWINDTDSTSGGASTGNITFSDTTMASTNGNVKIGFLPSASPAVEFTFATSGNLVLPAGTILSETANSTSITPPNALAGQGLVVRLTGAQGIASDHPGGFTDGDTIIVYVTPDYNVTPVTGTVDYTFTGATSVQLGRALTGTLTFTSEPSKQITWTIPVSSTMTTFTITLSNASGFDISGISPLTLTTTGSTEDHHIHLIAGDPSITDIYLGDDDQYVKIEKNGGNVLIGTNTNTKQWKFGTDGSLTLPGNFHIGSGEGSLGIGSPNDVAIAAGQGNTDQLWLFGTDGGLTFPDDTNQTTAYRNRPLTNLNLDGGSASVVFEIDMAFVDCGGSYLRGILSQDVYDGTDGGSTTTQFDKILDGGQS